MTQLTQNPPDYECITWIMDRQIREKNHQTSKVWAFWACQLAAQTKSIYVEKNVAQSIKCTKTENNFTLK